MESNEFFHVLQKCLIEAISRCKSKICELMLVEFLSDYLKCVELDNKKVPDFISMLNRNKIFWVTQTWKIDSNKAAAAVLPMPLLTAKNSRDATLLKLTCSDVFYFDGCPKQDIRRSLEAKLSKICNVISQNITNSCLDW